MIDERGRYVFHSFDQMRPFSSFLPGIGGLYGIPMWVFYTNRGQAISSFGVESKDRPIMEFQPANKAYQLTASLGFRTFVSGEGWFTEPFSPWYQDSIQRDMFMGMNELEIRETNQTLGLETSVVYFNLLDEPFAGLARQVSFRNIGSSEISFDLLDGMPAIMPFGVDNGLLKHIGRTIEAWMEVFELESGIPFFRLRASAGDTSEVRSIEAGNFSLAYCDGERLPAFVDPVVIFERDTSFSYPHGLRQGLDGLIAVPQITEGRTPCSFFGMNISLAAGEAKTVSSIYGYAESHAEILEQCSKVSSDAYVHQKREESRQFAITLTDPVAARTAHPIFDAYTRQTFLDNVMRGGWPEVLANRHVYHVFSRKHGDPERDYNHFYLAAEHFSQGNANFRDVNQNRRLDVFFEPGVGDFNIRLFMSLIQTDGYNPLIVQGTRFTLDKEKQDEILTCTVDPVGLSRVLARPFTPGELLRAGEKSGISIPPAQFLDMVMGAAQQQIQAEYGEGYWVDHWTYNLDLIESFLAVYPERKSSLLFDSEPLPFFDSPAVVKPRDKKYVLDHGQPGQHNAVEEDAEKHALINSRPDQPNWVRTEYGQGTIFRLPLISKLVMLVGLKFATRDPYGMGLEMEAGRPGWCDAMNGLPGLFGSSMAETFELLRLTDFLLETLKEDPQEAELPLEFLTLLEEMLRQIKRDPSPFKYWDNVSTAREFYREETRLGVSGKTAKVSAEKLQSALELIKEETKAGIEAAVEENGGVPPTYFYYQLDEYELTGEKDAQGRAFLQARGFKQVRLPLYLEGPVRMMKTLNSRSQAETLYERVRCSELFDEKLGQYKLNASLMDCPIGIGRARAFSPGWLENESIWMHMSFKYLLEILKAGIYDEFFNDFKSSLPSFMDPAVYGRSPLENSSFIVSSAHPDGSLHGRGFVARLSGSTAEFLQIWQLMMTGSNPFSLKDGKLLLKFSPIIPGWLFPESGEFAFAFLGGCSVTYHNQTRQDTWAANVGIRRFRISLPNGDEVSLSGDTIPAPYAEQVREGHISAIDIFFDAQR